MTTVNRATSNRRLLKLAEFLETLPRKSFDYGLWHITNQPECGTIACALGWATTIRSFRRLGVTRSLGGIPKYHGAYGWDAGAALFGLTEDEAKFLFLPAPEASLYNITDLHGIKPLKETATPKQVAKLIKQFVKRRPSINR